jgi:hypothetical protein
MGYSLSANAHGQRIDYGPSASVDDGGFLAMAEISHWNRIATAAGEIWLQ